MSRGLILSTPVVAASLLALSACSQTRDATTQGATGVNCSICHGTAGRTGELPGTDPLLEAAPPVAPAGAPAHAVGAHLAHLNPPAASAQTAPLACAECHVVPGNASHAMNPPAAKVVFGPLASTQGSVPTWNGATTGCSATYCHGNFDFNGVTGAAATPLWTGASTSCVSCHGMPPTGHPPVSGTITAVTCSLCHPDTVQSDGRINTAAGKHVNGLADVTLACTSCHGTPGRTGNLPGTDPLLAASPPAAPRGAPAHAVGAHQAHLNPPSAGAFRAPIDCVECHVVPTDASHAVNPPAVKVTFGPLATTQANSPSWNVSTTTCSSTYCHGSFAYLTVQGNAGAPSWTATGIGCTDCHGLPPTGHPALAGTVTARTCNACHPASVNPDGSINVASGAHMNGQSNVAASCTSCHGDAARAATTANPMLPSAPPVAAAGTDARTVGLHLHHLQDGLVRSAVACNECHLIPENADHSVTRPAVITWSPGTLATTGHAAPSYSPAPAMTCSATYCHGNFRHGAVTGNAGATAAWDSTPTNACTACHGMPPTGHQPVTAPVTAASCNGCHAQTVNADGTIDVAGGKHVNGLPDYTGGHPAGWVDPTQHGFAASRQGLSTCTSCHVGFGPASGVATSSCDACHSSALGGADWKTTCTFCHGTAGRTLTYSGSVGHPMPSTALLAASPPVGPQGETGTTGAVGAHQRHVNPPLAASGGRATPFECGNCHGTNIPTNVDHVMNVSGLPPVPFGLIAITGNVTTARFDYTARTCSATYCHGNFTGGVGAASSVQWNATGLACNACHANPPATGEHSKHVSSERLACSVCHAGYPATTSPTTVNVTLHVNGVKDVGGTGTSIRTWTRPSCTPSDANACHSTKSW